MLRSRTLISRSSSAIIKELPPLPKSTLLYSVSSNTPDDCLKAILSSLRRSAQQSVGCLSAPHPRYPDRIVCSTAYFDSDRCTPFLSTIPGRAPIHVGRRNTRAPTTRLALDIDSYFTDSPWGDFSHSGSSTIALPTMLANTHDITSLLFFSDNSPDGLVRALDRLPANKMGLIASSTPFINGRPFTLFFNDEVHSSGAVGVALRTPKFLEPTICFGGLEPLAAELGVVTQSEGNLIRQINGSNAAQVLIDAIATTGRRIAKEDDIYIRMSRTEASSSRIYKVLSGGPSRGFIALDTDEAVKTKTYLEVTVFREHCLICDHLRLFQAYTRERYHTSLISPDPLSAYFINSADSDPKAYIPAEEVEDELPKKTFQVRSENKIVIPTRHITFILRC
ncbi:hypothetical protein BU17DRAFT_57934 [Hysterangium stoloniferum]|nr:hypothetical protein BU17DRAFT_57934 [Hysterangium stoloniferum]